MDTPTWGIVFIFIMLGFSFMVATFGHIKEWYDKRKKQKEIEKDDST